MPKKPKEKKKDKKKTKEGKITKKAEKSKKDQKLKIKLSLKNTSDQSDSEWEENCSIKSSYKLPENILKKQFLHKDFGRYLDF